MPLKLTKRTTLEETTKLICLKCHQRGSVGREMIWGAEETFASQITKIGESFKVKVSQPVIVTSDGSNAAAVRHCSAPAVIGRSNPRILCAKQGGEGGRFLRLFHILFFFTLEQPCCHFRCSLLLSQSASQSVARDLQRTEGCFLPSEPAATHSCDCFNVRRGSKNVCACVSCVRACVYVLACACVLGAGGSL